MELQDTASPGDTHIMPLRIERGAVAEAVDGPVGTIEQIIMDRSSGQVSALVIHGSDTGNEFELPVRYADAGRSTNHHIYLKLTRRELTDNPDMVRPYNPDQYTPVYQGEAVPESAATRVATESDRPVVTDIEEDAAELVIADAEQGTRPVAGRTDTGVTSRSVAGAGVAGTVGATEDTTPTVKLNAAQPTTGKAIAGDQRVAPAPEVSETPATTGALMGGKPSTSGMGEKSYVPSSSAPALDTVPTSSNLPPYTTEHSQETNATPNLAPETEAPQMTASEVEPSHATPVELSAQPASEALVDETPSPFRGEAQGIPESVPPPDQALGGSTAPVLTETVITSGAVEPSINTPAQPQLLDSLKERLPMLLSLARSPVVLLAASGLVVSVATRIALRRRTAAREQARRSAARAGGQAAKTVSQAHDTAEQLARSAQAALRRAGNQAQAKARKAQARVPDASDHLTQQAKDTAGQVAAQTKDVAVQAREQAKDTGRQIRKGAKRSARQFRWFRTGVAAGAALSILYAPQPGAELRMRLANTIEQLRSRSA